MFENCNLLTKLQNTYIKFKKCYVQRKKADEKIDINNEYSIEYNDAICKFACKNMFKGCISLT